MTNNEAIEILNTMLEDGRYLGNGSHIPLEVLETFNKAKEALENQKTGHWIELGCVGNDNYDFECSECQHTDTHSKTVKVNYCWYCGAKMEDKENES